MSILYSIFVVCCFLIAFFLVLPFLMVLLSRLRPEKNKDVTESDPNYKIYDYACIITAYRNAEIAKPLVQSLLRQKYPKHHIYLVADESDISGWDLIDKQLTILNPNPPLRLKVKSIIHAVENFIRAHDYIAVFDADNLAHPNFLKEINWYANNGSLVIQGQRTAKNLDTMYACADATGEFYKNFTDRYVPYLIGSSAVISGSGMAVESKLYKAYLESPEIEQGKHQWKKMLQEDKILQNNLLFKNEKISYALNAIVYDEKVVSGQQVETQRSRWLFSYFQNLPNSSGLLLKGILKLSWNQFIFGLVTIAPPMFIQLFLGVVLTIISFFIDIRLSLIMGTAVVLFGLNILLVLYLSRAPKQIWKAIWGLPFFVLNQFRGLLKMGNPNKNFKHSEHTRKVSIDDVLKSEEPEVH
jgi:cellulose synthase/poly-beta-1,6-N-acetylglucosamine synthase-like glycosyltransferase